MRKWLTIFSLVFSAVLHAQPTVFAGADSTLTISPVGTRWNQSGRDTAFVHGTVTGATGTVTYAWSKISGTGGNILRPTDKNTYITDLSVGSYVFRLTITASNGTASDDVALTVTTCTQTFQTIVPGGDGGVFMVGGVVPGRTFIMDASTAPTIAYTYMKGWTGAPGCPVKVQRNGTVVMKNGFALDGVHWFEVDGLSGTRGAGDRVSPTWGDTCGIQIRGQFKETVGGVVKTYAQDGVAGFEIFGASTDVDVHNIEMHKLKYGFQIKDDDQCDTTLNYPYGIIYQVRVHNCWGHQFESQFDYSGNTSPNNGHDEIRPRGCYGGTVFLTPGRIGGFEVDHNDIDTMGRPGIQLSDHIFGMARVHHNHIDFTGGQTDETQGGGFSTGGYTRAIGDSNNIQHNLTFNVMGFGTYLWLYDDTLRYSGYTVWNGNWIYQNPADHNSPIIGVNPDAPYTLAYGAPMHFRANPTYPMDSARVWSSRITVSDSRINDINDANKYVQTYYSAIGLDYTAWAYDNRYQNITYNGAAVSGSPQVQAISGVHVANTTVPMVAWISAGVDQITYETSTALSTAFAHPMGGHQIISTQWSKVSGPAGGTIQSPSTLWTVVYDLQPGIYTYRLTVTDDAENVTTDDVMISVGNIFPVSGAGPDQTVSLPVSSVTLHGSASDADGSILWHNWNVFSQTNASWWIKPAISDIYSFSPTVTGFPNETGTYTFRQTVVDNTGVQVTDDMVVTVQASGTSGPPTVNAGSDQVVTGSSVSLSGSATPGSGQTISAYNWTTFSGPSSPTITTPTNQNTSVTGLVQGTYTFRLTATQSDAQTGLDDVQITVVPIKFRITVPSAFIRNGVRLGKPTRKK